WGRADEIVRWVLHEPAQGHDHAGFGLIGGNRSRLHVLPPLEGCGLDLLTGASGQALGCELVRVARQRLRWRLWLPLSRAALERLTVTGEHHVVHPRCRDLPGALGEPRLASLVNHYWRSERHQRLPLRTGIAASGQRPAPA